jgi:hypothetical protein
MNLSFGPEENIGNGSLDPILDNCDPVINADIFIHGSFSFAVSFRFPGDIPGWILFSRSSLSRLFLSLGSKGNVVGDE